MGRDLESRKAKEERVFKEKIKLPSEEKVFQGTN